MPQPHHVTEQLIDERRDQAAVRNARGAAVLLAEAVCGDDVVALAVGGDPEPGSAACLGTAPEAGREVRRQRSDVQAHQTPMLRPMISFMISVVPP